MAVGMCAVVTLSLTIFAFQTKIDFTAWGGEHWAVPIQCELNLFISCNDSYIIKWMVPKVWFAWKTVHFIIFNGGTPKYGVLEGGARSAASLDWVAVLYKN